MGLRHKGCAAGNITYTFIDFHAVTGFWSPDIIQAFRFSLNNIGRITSGLYNGIVDTGFWNNMLSQIIHANIH